MGWYGTPNASKQDIIDEILDDFRNRDVLRESKIVRETGTTILWVVVAEAGKYQYIVCYLISKGGDCWGYKPMDESMGPNYYSVPKEWLAKYPCITPDGSKCGYSVEWREKVLAA